MFRFRLSKVLKFRTRHMEAEARKLHAIESAARQLELENDRIAARCRQLADEEAGSVSGLDLGVKRRLAEYMKGRRIQIRRNIEEAAAIRVRAEKQRQVLLAAQRETRVLELLRDKQRSAWNEDRRRRDQKITDEIAARGSGLQA